MYEPQGSFIVDIGGGTTEVALVSMGGVVLSHSVRVAGNKIDEAIAGFLKKQHAILVTDRVAEQIKFDLLTSEAKGRWNISLWCADATLATACR